MSTTPVARQKITRSAEDYAKTLGHLQLYRRNTGRRLQRDRSLGRNAVTAKGLEITQRGRRIVSEIDLR
jgi:hypothetical protein